MNQRMNFDPDKLREFSLKRQEESSDISPLMDELRSNDSAELDISLDDSFDDAFDIFDEQMLVPDSLTDEGVKFKEELKEQGLDGELTFYISGYDASAFYEDVIITEKKVNASGKTLYRIKDKNGRDLLFTVDEIKDSVNDYARCKELIAGFLKKGIDIKSGVIVNPNTGEMTPDIRLVSMTRSETGAIDFNFVFNGGSFVLDQKNFLSQIQRSVAIKKHGLRLSDYVGLDRSNPDRTFKVSQLSEDRHGFVVMQDQSGVTQEFPVWHLRSVARNQEILNSEVQGESASEVLKSLKELGRKIDAAKDFDALLQLSSEFEALISYKVPPTLSGNMRADYDLLLNNRVNQFDVKLEEFAPYKSVVERFACLKQDVEVTTDTAKLQQLLEDLNSMSESLKAFESESYMALTPLRADFHRKLNAISRLKAKGIDKLNSLNLFNGVNEALNRFNPGYETSIRRVNRFKDRFKFLNFEGVNAHEKIYAHVSLEVEAFRSEFLDPIYENHKAHSRTVATLHRKFCGLYNYTFGQLDSDPLCLRKNTSEFVDNWTEMMRYFEMFNFAEEASSLSVLEVTEDGSTETLRVDLDETLEDLPEFDKAEDVYATFKRMESKKNAKIAELVQKNSEKLNELVRSKLMSLASIFGFTQDELEHGMLDSFQEMVETNKIPAVFNESKGFEHRFEDLLQRVASIYPKLVSALKCDLSEFCEEYFSLLKTCNLAIVANSRVSAPTPKSSRGLIGSMRNALSNVFRG